MSVTDFNWSQVASRRKIWEPNNPKPKSETSKASNTISRGLALTDLEISVQDFILEGLDHKDSQILSGIVRDTLLRNVEDEVKHEKALGRAKAAMSDYNPEFESEGQAIINAWNDLDCNPVLKTAVLEVGVFFPLLGMYSMWGGTSLGISARSISADESIHASSHRVAAQLLGTRPTKALNSLRLETLDWLGSDLDKDCVSMSKSRLIENSNRLIKSGTSDMMETSVYTVLCPYEISNRNFDTYG
jgi:hypothetical protein